MKHKDLKKFSIPRKEISWSISFTKEELAEGKTPKGQAKRLKQYVDSLKESREFTRKHLEQISGIKINKKP